MYGIHLHIAASERQQIGFPIFLTFALGACSLLDLLLLSDPITTEFTKASYTKL